MPPARPKATRPRKAARSSAGVAKESLSTLSTPSTLLSGSGSDSASSALSGQEDDEDEDGTGNEKDYRALALAQLQAHMAASFGPSAPAGPSDPRSASQGADALEGEEEEDARSDYGFSDGTHGSESDAHSGSDDGSEDDEMSRTLAALDRPAAPASSTGPVGPVTGKRRADGFPAARAAPGAKKPKRPKAGVVVVDGDAASGASSGSVPAVSASERRRFMASQTSKVLSGPDVSSSKPAASEVEDSEEKAAKANDRLLSELLASTLFAPGGEMGSAALSSTSVGKKRKNKPDYAGNATLARVLELSAPAHVRARVGIGRGVGVEALRAQELGRRGQKERRQADRGLKRRQAEEKARQVELGIHTKTFVAKDKKERTRDKGLGMGIGKFKGGALHLSQKDIDRVQGKKR